LRPAALNQFPAVVVRGLSGLHIQVPLDDFPGGAVKDLDSACHGPGQGGADKACRQDAGSHGKKNGPQEPADDLLDPAPGHTDSHRSDPVRGNEDRSGEIIDKPGSRGDELDTVGLRVLYRIREHQIRGKAS